MGRWSASSELSTACRGVGLRGDPVVGPEHENDPGCGQGKTTPRAQQAGSRLSPAPGSQEALLKGWLGGLNPHRPATSSWLHWVLDGTCGGGSCVGQCRSKAFPSDINFE